MPPALTVSVPDRQYLGDLPDDVEILEWDGFAARPPGGERIQFFVGRYGGGPPPADAFAGLPSLRVIQVLSAGVEPWLPLIPSGVTLCNGRGVHGSSTAELAVAGMLSILRGLPTYLDAQRRRDWQPMQSGGLAGRRVLIVGVGDIGGRVAGIAEILDAQVTMVGRSAREGVRSLVDLSGLLPQQDVVVLAVPHTEATHHLVNKAFLAALPDGALVVNVSRGAIVDTGALLAELQAERLHAYLDVTDPEPLPTDHPLWGAPNLLITPHVGGGTRGWAERAGRLVHEQILRCYRGEELLNQVSTD